MGVQTLDSRTNIAKDPFDNWRFGRFDWLAEVPLQESGGAKAWPCCHDGASGSRDRGLSEQTTKGERLKNSLSR